MLGVDDVRVSARKYWWSFVPGSATRTREVPVNALVLEVHQEWLSKRSARADDDEQALFVGRGGHRLSKRSVDDVVRCLGEGGRG